MNYRSIARLAILPVRHNDREIKLMNILEPLNPKAIYEMVAEIGFRKYFIFGGFQATQELIQLLFLDNTKTVLEVGCASGKTAC